MSYSANVYKVFIASPSDTVKERAAAEKAIHEWNIVNSDNSRIVLLPLLWEKNAAPSMTHNGQGEIDNQLLEHADILVGIFKARVGSPTKNDISGTVGEIEKHSAAQKLTMLYFYTGSVANDHDQAQLSAVRKLKADFQQRSLTADFKSTSEFSRLFSKQLSLNMNRIESSKTDKKSLTNNDHAIQQIVKAKQNITHMKVEIDGKSFSIIKEAITLLSAIFIDKHKQLIFMRNKLNTSMIANGRNFLSGDDRTKAIWKNALGELLEHGLLEAIGNMQQVYGLTKRGYDVVDYLDIDILG